MNVTGGWQQYRSRFNPERLRPAMHAWSYLRPSVGTVDFDVDFAISRGDIESKAYNAYA